MKKRKQSVPVQTANVLALFIVLAGVAFFIYGPAHMRP